MALSANGAVHDARRTACATQRSAAGLMDIIEPVRSTMARADTEFGALDLSMATTRASIQAVAAELDASRACAALGDAAASASAITSSSSTAPAKFTAATGQLREAETGACETAELRATLVDARTAVDSGQDALRAGGGLFSLVGRALSSFEQLPTTFEAVLDSDVYPLLWHSAMPALGPAVALFSMVILLGVLPGVCCLSARKRPRRACAANGCGVQCVGGCWVLSSLVVVVYLLAATVLLPTTALLTDALYISRLLPGAPRMVLGDATCALLDARVGGVDVCGAVQQCLGGGGSSSSDVSLGNASAIVDLIPALVTGGGGARVVRLDSVSAQRDALSNEWAALHVRTLQMAADSTQLDSANADLLALAPADFGAPPGHPAHATVGEQLAYLTGNVSVAIASIGPVEASAAELQGNLLDVLDGMGVLIGVLSEAVDALGGVDFCAWAKGTWDGVLTPLADAVEVGIGGFACAVCLSGILFAVWIAPAIGLQIRCGEVGREPGCPSCCRCCCGEAVPRGTRTAVKKEAQAVTTDGFSSIIGV